jgi:hypothetical protein
MLALAHDRYPTRGDMTTTRCLNCGAPRDAEVCEACGLDSTAAEFQLRRKLLNHTGLFLLGSIAFVTAAVRYPPLELDGILIFIGVLFFLTLGLEMWLERSVQKHFEVEALKRIFFVIVPVPWLLGGLLLLNGAADRAPFSVVESHVVAKFAMRGPMPNRRLIVRSWRDGDDVERISVDRIDYDQFSNGDPILLHLKSGLVGIPWVAGVIHK